MTTALINFAILTIEYFHNPTSITITIATSALCHLTCYYTDKEPLKHATARTIRGITLPWGNYFCFVAWKTVEQTEPGDTLIHTFEIPDWTQCQTKYFTFKGTVESVISPSVGPIFSHHHTGIELFCNLGFETYPITPGVPPCWKPDSYGVGVAAYFRDEVNVQEGIYSCKINAVGMDFSANLLQKRWSSPYLGKTVKFTFNWFGMGRGGIAMPFWSIGFYFGPGWHAASKTVTFSLTPYLWFIKLETGGMGSAFTQLTWDNMKIQIL